MDRPNYPPGDSSFNSYNNTPIMVNNTPISTPIDLRKYPPINTKKPVVKSEVPIKEEKKIYKEDFKQKKSEKKEGSNENKKDNKDNSDSVVSSQVLKSSFKTSYLILMGSSLITVIEALRTKDEKARHILNIESAVNLIAGLVYGYFAKMIDENNMKLSEIIPMRYVDWFITTPLLLLTLLLFFSYLNGDHLHFSYFFFVLVMNFLMLVSGYLGETNVISINVSVSVGFVFYFVLFIFIYYHFIHGRGIDIQKKVFFVFAFIWALYGIVHYIEDEKLKNLLYNILDVIAKVFFGLFMWVYYGKVMEF